MVSGCEPSPCRPVANGITFRLVHFDIGSGNPGWLITAQPPTTEGAEGSCQCVWVAERLPKVVEEDDFVVRVWQPDDAEVLHEAVIESTEHLRPWMDWIAQEPMSVSQRRALIEEWEHGWEQGGSVPMGVFQAGVVVGGSGYVNRKEHSLEIGYWVRVGQLGKGHASRAVRLLTSAAFAIPEINQVEIHHDKANVKSAAIPPRLGYHFLGEKPQPIRAPGQMGIGCVWIFTRQDWVTPAP